MNSKEEMINMKLFNMRFKEIEQIGYAREEDRKFLEFAKVLFQYCRYKK